MLALRYASLLAIAVWIGGLLALGAIVAPATFETVAARGIRDGSGLSGAIFGEALRRFHLVAYVCGAFVLFSLVVRKLLGPTPRPFAVRVGIAALMLATTLYSGMSVSPEIARMREAIGGSPSALPQADPRRAAFGRLHATSTGLQLVPLIGGLVLMLWELRD